VFVIAIHYSCVREKRFLLSAIYAALFLLTQTPVSVITLQTRRFEFVCHVCLKKMASVEYRKKWKNK